MGLSHGLALQILAREAKQYRRLAGELLLFSGHLQNIRLFIVGGNAKYQKKPDATPVP